MLHETSLIWWHLGILSKKRYDLLKQLYGDVDGALADLSEEFLSKLKMKEETVRDTLDRLGNLHLEKLDAQMKRAGIQLCSIEDDEYPAILREIGDPPIFLSYKGDLSLAGSAPLVGLVGTRASTHYGRQVTVRFVDGFVDAGMITVSGLAAGIDTVVAEETLKMGGKTIAVFGTGFGQIFPAENEPLSREIVAKGGLLLSEFPLYQGGGNFTFPARNRIIAGLSRGTVVIEAPLGSGALITADLALDYGRDVFAVPGSVFDVNFEGCHKLIANGHAKLVTTPDDVLKEWGAVSVEKITMREYEPANEDERSVYNVLGSIPKAIDDVIQESRIDSSRVNIALTMLELAGVAENIGGNKWTKK